MTLDKIIVTISGIVAITFTYWFFLMRKEEVVVAAEAIDILVDGGYTPQVISIPKGQLTKLNFLRKDSNSCLEELIIPEFKIHQNLPLHQTITIELIPQEIGIFDYTCGMNMYRGKIIVKG